MAVHDLKYIDLAHGSSKFPTEPKHVLYWWCVCGNYQGRSLKLDQANMVEDFLEHLAVVSGQEMAAALR